MNDRLGKFLRLELWRHPRAALSNTVDRDMRSRLANIVLDKLRRNLQWRLSLSLENEPLLEEDEDPVPPFS